MAVSAVTENVGIQADMQPRKKVKGKNRGVQTHSPYMVRYPDDLSGSWIPLDSQSVRRGSSLRWVSATQTHNANSVNLLLCEGTKCKVLDVDEDGDSSIVLLSHGSGHNLHVASEKNWLLKSRFDCFETWLPVGAHTEATKLLREGRAQNQEDEPENG